MEYRNIIFQSNEIKNLIISMMATYDKETIIYIFDQNKNNLVDFHRNLLEWLIKDIPD